MNRSYSTLALLGGAVLASCGGEKGTSVGSIVEPVIVPTVSIVSISSTLDRVSFPKSVITASGKIDDGQGNAVSSGYIWKLDGAPVEGGLSLQISGVEPGQHSLCLSYLKVERCSGVLSEDKRPLEVRVFVARPDGPIAGQGLEVCATGNLGRDCYPLDNEGKASVYTRYQADSSFKLISQCVKPNCGILPTSSTATRNSFFSPYFINTSVSSWTLSCPRWGGKVVSLDLISATTLTAFPPSFFMRRPITTDSNTYSYSKETWQSFPINVWFDRDKSDTSEALDSLIGRASSYIESLNDDLCMGKVFQLSTVPLEKNLERSFAIPGGRVFHFYKNGVGIVARLDLPSLGGPAQENGWLKNGVVLYNQGSHVSYTKLKKAEFKHELVHNLGVGHGGGTLSFGLMGSRVDETVNWPTFGDLYAEEVAHIQLFHAIRRLEKENGGTGIEALDQGAYWAAGSAIESAKVTLIGNLPIYQ